MKHKRVIAVIATVALLSIASVGSVFAENETTINSKGKILTSSDEVLFDASDFKTLADKMDKMDETLNTYLKIKNVAFDTVGIPAYGSETVSKELTVESGYNLIGLCGFGISGSNALCVNSIYIDYSTNIAYMTIYNSSDVAVNAQPWANFFESK